MAAGSAVANLGLSIALVGPYGVEGVAAGTLIASAAEIVLLVVPYAMRFLGVSLWQLLGEVVLPLVVPSATFAFLLIGGDALLPVTTLPRLALVVGGALTIYALTYALFGAASRERAIYRAATSAVLRRGRRGGMRS